MNGSWSVKFGVRDSSNGVAWGTWRDGNGTESNFGSLSLQSHPDQPDVQQLFAVGYLEGALTAERIYEEVVNLREVVLVNEGNLPSTDPKDFPELVDFLTENDRWAREQVAENPQDRFFRVLGLVLAQFDGLRAGYAAALAATSGIGSEDRTLSEFDFQMLNGVGDLFDLIPAVYPSLRKDFDRLPNEEVCWHL